MKQLWAPWRLEFILGKKERGCIFCNRQRRARDVQDLILHRGKYNFVMMNKYPYNSGHLMVVPNRHTANFKSLKLAELNELFSLTQRAIAILEQAMHPDGFNLGMNLGRAAGAGIAHHLHQHIVPRWQADTNFMPVLGETKQIPDHLENTYRILKKYWR